MPEQKRKALRPEWVKMYRLRLTTTQVAATAGASPYHGPVPSGHDAAAKPALRNQHKKATRPASTRALRRKGGKTSRTP
jgi:hypothetical protein